MGFAIENLLQLFIGLQGESNARMIDIDMSEWMRDWPDAKVDMLVQRPGEDKTYPVKTALRGGHLLWTPKREDVLIAGMGKAQIILTDKNDVELRSRVVQTIIGESIAGTEGEAPDPEQGWVHQVLQAANEVKSQVDVGTGTGLYIVNQRKDDQSKADRTAEEIKAAVSAGKTVLLREVSGELYSLCVNLGPNLYFTNVRPGLPGNLNSYGLTVKTAIMTEGDGIQIRVPTNGTLSPNPYKLKLTGAVEAEYDGSEEVVVKIPQAGVASNEITILRETDLTRVEDDSSYLFVLSTPWENDVVAGNNYKVTYNGVVYDLKATKASDLMPDAVPGILVLGNYSIMGMEGGDAKVPFCLAAYPNAAGAEMGGYAALVSNDGAESVTLSVTSYASVAPADLPKITLTIDKDGNVTSDTPFAEASKMTCGELQSALKVVQTGNYAGQPSTLEADVQVRRRKVELLGEMLEITFRQYTDPGDAAAMKETTRYIYWAAGGLQLANFTLSSLPIMNAGWGYDQQTYYLRCVGGVWQPETIDQLKEDLGLTGGETTTEDVFYTADGEVFTDVNGAVMHVQKGDQ